MLVYQRVFLVKLFRGSSFFRPKPSFGPTWLLENPPEISHQLAILTSQRGYSTSHDPILWLFSSPFFAQNSSKNPCLKWGYPQSSSIVMGFSIINHPAIGVYHIYISHFMEARPEMRRKKPAPCALSVPCVPWFWAPPPWHSGLLVFTAKLLELLCKLYQIALSGAIQFMIFPFPHPIHDFSLQASLAYDCWAFESAPKKVLVHTNRPQHLATSA